jgi:hypothetical protein
LGSIFLVAKIGWGGWGLPAAVVWERYWVVPLIQLDAPASRIGCHGLPMIICPPIPRAFCAISNFLEDCQLGLVKTRQRLGRMMNTGSCDLLKSFLENYKFSKDSKF